MSRPVTRKGHVVAVEERGKVQAIIVAFDDGTEVEIEAPNKVSIEPGFPVKQVDVGDGKPIYAWGRPLLL
jgi:hypothetical protein